jgi:signal transduction histidine kinase
LAKSGLEEARRAIGMLRDDALPGPQRLAALAGEFETDTGVPCPFEVDGQERDLPSECRLTLYRVTQEALTNIRKHAGPDAAAEVMLRYGQDELLVRVTDDGRGCAGLPRYGAVPAADPAGHGLAGMRERAAMYGGTVQAGPRPSRGFEVTARLPLPATAPAAGPGGTLSRGTA